MTGTRLEEKNAPGSIHHAVTCCHPQQQQQGRCATFYINHILKDWEFFFLIIKNAKLRKWCSNSLGGLSYINTLDRDCCPVRYIFETFSCY